MSNQMQSMAITSAYKKRNIWTFNGNVTSHRFIFLIGVARLVHSPPMRTGRHSSLIWCEFYVLILFIKIEYKSEPTTITRIPKMTWVRIQMQINKLFYLKFIVNLSVR